MNSTPGPLRDLTPSSLSPRPGWQWAALSFLATAALVLIIVAVAHPFDRGSYLGLGAYDAGFQDGLLRGTESAHDHKVELSAIAFRRGREAGRAKAQAQAANRFTVAPGATSGSIWLQTTVAELGAQSGPPPAAAGTGQVALQDTAAYQRGYRDGYADQRDGGS